MCGVCVCVSVYMCMYTLAIDLFNRNASAIRKMNGSYKLIDQLNVSELITLAFRWLMQ